MASDTRTRILSVAARLFEAHGFEGTAVASILREADVNSGSLYHFFSSKEALLVAVLEKYVETLEPGLLGAAERAADDPIEKIFALLELYRGRLLVSGFARGCPVADLAVEVGSRIPEAGERIREYFTRWSERIEGWLGDASDRGVSQADRRAMADFVLSTLQGSVLQARAVASIMPFDHSVAQLRRLIEAHFTGKAASGDPVSRATAVESGRSAERDGAAAIAGVPADSPRRVEMDDLDSVAASDAGWWRAW